MAATDRMIPELAGVNRGMMTYRPRSYADGSADMYGQFFWLCPCCGKYVPANVLAAMCVVGDRAAVRFRVRPMSLPRAVIDAWEAQFGRGCVWQPGPAPKESGGAPEEGIVSHAEQDT
jgi:hypothetical protein